MKRVVHFEIQAEDPHRAVKFYADVFGWEIKQWGDNPYWMVVTGKEQGEWGGINGGILARRGPPPEEGAGVNGYVCTIDVSSIDETTQAIGIAGGKIVVPKNHMQGVGWIAYCKDTEGNIFGLIQNDSPQR